MQRGQAINTTRRHARRQATPKTRFIRARTKGWFLPRKSSYRRLIGFQLSKCRRLRAFLSCSVILLHLLPLPALFAKPLSISLQMWFHLLNKYIWRWFWVAIVREEIILPQIWLHRPIAIDLDGDNRRSMHVDEIHFEIAKFQDIVLYGLSNWILTYLLKDLKILFFR